MDLEDVSDTYYPQINSSIKLRLIFQAYSIAQGSLNNYRAFGFLYMERPSGIGRLLM